MTLESVEIDLPAPLSVNRLRRIDWTGNRRLENWVWVADQYVLKAKRRAVNPLKLEPRQRFALEITFSEKETRIDLDNGLKQIIDYLARIELIEDDSPRHLRKLVVQWGHAPVGTKVRITPCP